MIPCVQHLLSACSQSKLTTQILFPNGTTCQTLVHIRSFRFPQNRRPFLSVNHFNHAQYN